MAKRSLESLTESMFYVLMSLLKQDLCGTEMAEFTEAKTHGRVRMGPGTLYTILAKFKEEGFIREVLVFGRKRTYRITESGIAAYQEEVERLRGCVRDAESEAER